MSVVKRVFVNILAIVYTHDKIIAPGKWRKEEFSCLGHIYT